MNALDRKKYELIRGDVASSSVVEEIQLLNLMAAATEVLNQRCFNRVKNIYISHGEFSYKNDNLRGMSNYCKAVKSAVTQFLTAVEPRIGSITYNVGRSQGNGQNEGEGARAYDQFYTDANEICRLLMIYVDRTYRSKEAVTAVREFLDGLPSQGVFEKEEILKFKLK